MSKKRWVFTISVSCNERYAVSYPKFIYNVIPIVVIRETWYTVTSRKNVANKFKCRREHYITEGKWRYLIPHSNEVIVHVVVQLSDIELFRLFPRCFQFLSAKTTNLNSIGNCYTQSVYYPRSNILRGKIIVNIMTFIIFIAIRESVIKLWFNSFIVY